MFNISRSVRSASMDADHLFYGSSSFVDPFFSHSLTSLTILLLAGGLIFNLGSVLVFSEVPKLLRSTVNTLVRNLFVLHIITTIALGTLITLDWMAWTHDRIDEIDQPYLLGYRLSYWALCPLVHFVRGCFVFATFGILWIMSLDRAMTILFPRSPHTMLLKRHPSLATITVCALSPVMESHYLLMPRSNGLFHRDCVYHVNGLGWRLASFVLYAIPLMLLTALSATVLARLRSIPAKSSTRIMSRIVLFVCLLNASYAICTAPHKVTEMTGAHESLQRVAEALLLLPVLVHPILYYCISENFRKALSRCLHRRRHLGHRRQCRHTHGSSRYGDHHGGEWSAAVTLTEMTTALSARSDETIRDKEPPLGSAAPIGIDNTGQEEISETEDQPMNESATAVLDT